MATLRISADKEVEITKENYQKYKKLLTRKDRRELEEKIYPKEYKPKWLK